jgi:nicotinate-nucleotide--dimethylbenzimidazole phosphoribosyltransferase
MALLDETCAAIVDVDHQAAAHTQRLLDEKTKPRRSLGRLEDLACTVAAITGRSPPAPLCKAIVLMAGDHGVAREGVSAYPPEVTRQMLLNFARDGAAINVLAGQVGARLVVVDMGVCGPDQPIPGVRSCRVKPGTDNFTRGPAMDRQSAIIAIEHGIRIASELAAAGINIIGIGEMGIGNTTAATALLAAFTGEVPQAITGYGTGIDDATWARKVDVIEKALVANRAADLGALERLAALGGFEIAGLAGVVLGAAAHRVPVVLDGFIASTAAMCAAGLAEIAARYVIASHRSIEVGHKLVLRRLGCKPLFDLKMRLGEGTGAALALPMIEAAVRVVHEMATFSQAQVADTGR